MSRTGPLAEPYPRFSDAEMTRRRSSLEQVMERREVRHLILYGANRTGSAVGWLTRWPVTREALVVMTPGERDVLLVNFYNHVPNAARIATEAEVRYAGKAMTSALDELERRGARGAAVGVIGPLGYAAYSRLAAFASRVVDLDADYTELRLTKSDEEIEWVRLGALLTDAAMGALREQARPGLSERDLGDIVERAYVAAGATTHIHYFGATPMQAPELSVPAQWPSTRRLQPGDALVCELSASFWDHPGQLLRTFAVAAEPAPLYEELHAVADAAFDRVLAAIAPGVQAQALVDATGVIEDAGFTTRDDLVHGFVGGYLPPVLGSRSRTLEVVADLTLRRGMTLVIQPNVVTPDERAGVQTGELVLVGEQGAERLHTHERGLLRVG